MVQKDDTMQRAYELASVRAARLEEDLTITLIISRLQQERLEQLGDLVNETYPQVGFHRLPTKADVLGCLEQGRVVPSKEEVSTWRETLRILGSLRYSRWRRSMR